MHKHQDPAQRAVDHVANQLLRAKYQDPAFRAGAAAYYSRLDVSHKKAFIRSNEQLVAALLGAHLIDAAEVNDIDGQSATQTEGGVALDPTVTEPVYTG